MVTKLTAQPTWLELSHRIEISSYIEKGRLARLKLYTLSGVRLILYCIVVWLCHQIGWDYLFIICQKKNGNVNHVLYWGTIHHAIRYGSYIQWYIQDLGMMGHGSFNLVISPIFQMLMLFGL